MAANNYSIIQRRALFGRRSSNGHIAEVPLAIYILMLVCTLPLINLFAMALGTAIICLSTHECASQAASQRRYADSLKGMSTAATSFLNFGVAKFAKMKPIGGYQNTGCNLFIEASNIGGSWQTYGPNTAVPTPINVSSNVYECRVQSTYQIGPAIEINFIPVLSAVPGIGTPVTICFNASRAAEYPQGLSQPQISSGANMPILDASATTGAFAGASMSTWNNPQIYQLIAAAGQTVVAETVIAVRANNPDWTNTGITVGPGQTLWIDLRSDGLWTIYPGVMPLTNANGSMANICPEGAPMPGSPGGLLVGQIATNPPFAVGTTYQNYAPGQNGNLALVCNDAKNNGTACYTDNDGIQAVRIILTQ